MTLKYDAILIPGGGVEKDGFLPEWTVRRLKKAIEMFTGDEKIIVLSAGTVHKPPVLDKEGFPIFESEAAADFLIEKGIEPENILIERNSLDTIGNAYFSRMIHVEPAKMENLVVITSEFHMSRTRAIFEWVFSILPCPIEYKLDFIEVSDDGLDEELVNLRIEKEKESLLKLNATKEKICNLSQFHDWLYSQHAAYATGLGPVRVEGRLLESY